MSGGDAVPGLPGAIYKSDGRSAVLFLQSYGMPEGSLQLAGDGLLGALDQHVEGAAKLAAN